MEFIDILTDKGENTGEFRDRDTVHREGLWHRTIHIWILTSKRELLVQLRHHKKEHNPGLWDISCAGHISHGQSSLEAALRELDEELGIKATEQELQFLFPTSQIFYFPDGAIDKEYCEVYLLERDISLSDLTLQDGEVEDVKLISLNELKRVLQENDRSYVLHLTEYEKLISFLSSTSGNMKL